VVPTLEVYSEGQERPIPLPPDEIGIRPTDPVGVAITLTPVLVTPTPSNVALKTKRGKKSFWLILSNPCHFQPLLATPVTHPANFA
jgi:hypothetical protein